MVRTHPHALHTLHASPHCADACEACVRKAGPTDADTPAAADTAAAQPTVPPRICVDNHAHVVARDERGGFACDGCGGGSGQSVRYHCESGCNFDLCVACAAAHMAAVAPAAGVAPPPVPVSRPSNDVPTPPAPAAAPTPAVAGVAAASFALKGSTSVHAHVMRMGPGGGFSCDDCHRGDSERRYKCKDGCGYDLCGACFLKYRQSDTMEAGDEDWTGEPAPLPSIGITFQPTRRDADGAKRVKTCIDTKKYGVLEYGAVWHAERLERQVADLIEVSSVLWWLLWL